MCQSAICVCSCGRVNPSASGSIGPRTVWTWAMDRDATRSRQTPERSAAARSDQRTPMPYRRVMRLILASELRPETVERLRAMSGLEVVDRSADDTFDARRLVDPDVEILVAPWAPDDLGRVPSLRWLQVRSA